MRVTRTLALTAIGGAIAIGHANAGEVIMRNGNFPKAADVFSTFCGSTTGCPGLTISYVDCSSSSCVSISVPPTTDSHPTKVAQVMASVLKRTRTSSSNYQITAVRGGSRYFYTWLATRVSTKIFPPFTRAIVDVNGTAATYPGCIGRNGSPSDIESVNSVAPVFISAGNEGLNGYTFSYSLPAPGSPAQCGSKSPNSGFGLGVSDCSAGTTPVFQALFYQGIDVPSGRPEGQCNALDETIDIVNFPLSFKSSFLPAGMPSASTKVVAAGGCVAEIKNGGDGTTCSNATFDQGTSFSAPFIGAAVLAAADLANSRGTPTSGSQAFTLLLSRATQITFTIPPESPSSYKGNSYSFPFVGWSAINSALNSL